MHKLPQRMLDQLLKPQAQHSTVSDATALQRSGLPTLLRDALQAAFNKSQAAMPYSLRFNSFVSGLLSARSTCQQSIGVTAQVAAIAESVVGREPFALVQVWSAAAPASLPCSAKPALLWFAPLQLGWMAEELQVLHASAGASRHRKDLQHHWHHLCTCSQSSAQRAVGGSPTIVGRRHACCAGDSMAQMLHVGCAAHGTWCATSGCAHV